MPTAMAMIRSLASNAILPCDPPMQIPPPPHVHNILPTPSVQIAAHFVPSD